MRRLTFAALFACALAAAAPASALTPSEAAECRRMAAEFKQQKQELDMAKEARDAAARIAEMTGERWENAEAVRNFSAGQAAEADKAKAAFDKAKAAHQAAEARLAEKVSTYQANATAFNQKCAAKN